MRVETERSPKQPCASEVEAARAQPACWSSAHLSGDLTCSLSSALLYLRLRTLTMSSQFQQVNCFKSCYFSLLRALCTLILAVSGDWEHRRKRQVVEIADLGDGILHYRPVQPHAGTFCCLVVSAFFFIISVFKPLPSLPHKK